MICPSRKFLPVFLVLLMEPFVAYGQSSQRPLSRPDGQWPSTYYAVLDVLFPRKGESKPVITLRFIPSLQRSPAPKIANYRSVYFESQVVIQAVDDENYKIVFLRTKGDESISDQVGRIMTHTPIRNVTEIARMIAVDKQEVNLPREVIVEFLSSLAELQFFPKPENLMVLDGQHHQLWYQSPTSAELYFSYVDGTSGDDDKTHPVVRWMNRVKTEVEKRAKDTVADNSTPKR